MYKVHGKVAEEGKNKGKTYLIQNFGDDLSSGLRARRRSSVRRRRKLRGVISIRVVNKFLGKTRTFTL
jgi:hypothetical protein